jgi:outer membrane lipoprotein SlyB
MKGDFAPILLDDEPTSDDSAISGQLAVLPTDGGTPGRLWANMADERTGAPPEWVQVPRAEEIPPPPLLVSQQLPRLLSKYQSTGTVNPSFLFVGDSVMEGKISAFESMLSRVFGGIASNAGATMGWSNGAGQVTTGSQVYDLWPTGRYYTLPAAGILTAGKAGGTVRIPADRVHVYYYREPGAGTFKIQASRNGGDYEDVIASVDAEHSSVTIGIEIIDLLPGDYLIRLVGLTGDVKIPRIMRFMTLGGIGAHIADIQRGGINVAQASQTPVAITQPVIADLAPDVILVEFLDTPELMEQGFAALMENLMSGLSYRPDILVLGSANVPNSGGGLEAATKIQREWCEDDGHAFIDLAYLFGPTPEAAALAGLQLPDNVHPTPLGYAAQVTHIFGEIHSITGGPLDSSTRPGSLNLPHSPLSLENDWRAAIIASPIIRNLFPSSSVFSATPTHGQAGLSSNYYRISIAQTADIGNFAQAIIGGVINSGVGTGLGTRFNTTIGFSVTLAISVKVNVVASVILGAPGVITPTTRAIGVRIDANNQLRLIAHDGTTLTESEPLAIANNQSEQTFVVESDGLGNVFFYNNVGDDHGIIARVPKLRISGGPTGTAPSGAHFLTARMEAVDTPLSGGTSQIALLNASVFVGRKFLS